MFIKRNSFLADIQCLLVFLKTIFLLVFYLSPPPFLTYIRYMCDCVCERENALLPHPHLLTSAHKAAHATEMGSIIVDTSKPAGISSRRQNIREKNLSASHMNSGDSSRPPSAAFWRKSNRKLRHFHSFEPQPLILTHEGLQKWKIQREIVVFIYLCYSGSNQ